MRQLIATCLALTAAAVLIACGGGDDDEPTKPALAPAPPADAGAAAGSALDGDPPDVEGGTLIASSGFDIKTESFAFENFAGNPGPGIRAQEMREMFGDGVCVDRAQDPCQLTPTAERWRQMNTYTGGHCYGFAALSLLMHRGVIKPQTYGADKAWDIRVVDEARKINNPEFMADLTRSAAMQQLAGVQRQARRYTPTKFVEVLRKAFESGNGDFVLSVRKETEGGHAIVPWGIEDLGNGQYDILLYDNNYPYIPGRPEYADRRLRIDTKTDSWSYQVQLVPGDPSKGVWGNSGLNEPLKLTPASALSLPQPCPFCEDAPAAVQETSVVLESDPVDHGHLRITDAQGNVTGWNGEEFVNEIPGAKRRDLEIIRRELLEPEPYYDLPEGKAFTVELVDVPEGAPPAELHVSAPGVGVGVERIAEGTALRIGEDGRVVVVRDDASAPAPEVTVAAPDDTELRFEPAGERVAVVPRGDDVLLAGQIESGAAVDAADGDRAKLPHGGGVIRLDKALGG